MYEVNISVSVYDFIGRGCLVKVLNGGFIVLHVQYVRVINDLRGDALIISTYCLEMLEVRPESGIGTYI